MIDDPSQPVFHIDQGVTRDGVIQVRRRWSPSGDAVASMLLLHGLGEHGGRYEHVGQRFASAGVDVVAIDLRGFGLSGGRRAHVDSFERYLDDVEDQLAQIRPLGHRMVLLGHSMGGLIAARYAASGRPMTDLLVLSGPALEADIPRWQEIAAPIMGRVAPRMKIPTEISGDLLSTDPAVGQAYEADPLVSTHATAGLGRAMFEAMSWTSENLKRIVVPTYVVHGGDDRLVPPSASEIFEGRPETERTVYDGMRHEVFNEPTGLDVVDQIVEWIIANL
ncbi:MAG: alpha/beta hydrolase [Acidobacteria bacterium]|nr:alpha/beta hydrolase [Acidobacteriota bacterium]